MTNNQNPKKLNATISTLENEIIEIGNKNKQYILEINILKDENNAIKLNLEKDKLFKNGQ
jgi:hypothetical protein